MPEKIAFLLQYAQLAPSTHNIQPWLFKVEGDRCKIYYNPKLALPEGDVLGRDCFISLGCATENLVIAAKYYGVYGDVTYFDGSQDQLAVEVTFKHLDQPAGPTDESLRPLLDAILGRFNARGVFHDRPVPAEVLSTLQSLNAEYGPSVQLNLVTDKAGVTALAELTAEGLRRAYHRPAFRAEIAGWIRHNLSKKRDGIPAWSLRMPTPLSFVISWLMRNIDIGTKLAKLNYASLNSAPLVCVYTADANTPENYLKTGRLAERVMLEMTRNGMRTSIFVASVEIDDLYKDVQKVINSDKIPQFLMCGGYITTPQGNTPRQPLESKML